MAGVVLAVELATGTALTMAVPTPGTAPDDLVAPELGPAGIGLGLGHWFTAQVVRIAHMEQDGRTRYLVGCRFLGRVEL